ncbi:hypothetical protein GCM10025734_47620 [Kitasatospora paranensis]|uniref:hypothetical protein n=1 Tax=Kitasatospora paranensis TaxID=258053 RepID=UPI0031E62730
MPLYSRLDALHRSLRYPALSSALAAFALAGSGVLIIRLVQRQTGTTGLLVGLGLALLPLPFVLGAVAWLNQAARVPLRHALFCLAWGPARPPRSPCSPTGGPATSWSPTARAARRSAPSSPPR